MVCALLCQGFWYDKIIHEFCIRSQVTLLRRNFGASFGALKKFLLDLVAALSHPFQYDHLVLYTRVVF